MTEENPVTKVEEEVPFMIQVDLENGLDEDTQIDLQFKKGFTEYNRMFSRKFGFSNEEEMNLVKGILETIMQYEQAQQTYIISETMNDYVYIKNLATNSESYVNMKSPHVMIYFRSILSWMREQYKYQGV